MKSCRQPKRKRVEISRNSDEIIGVTVKKPVNGTVRRSYKATESIRTPNLEPQLQIPSTKLKLQLFPINEQTRLVLEKDGHNPFLELTLSARKRISSVIKHMIAKWGSSGEVLGQPILFPYNTKLEELTLCRRWTSNDLAVTAWEVYVDVGSPSIFRLRYGWFSNLQQDMFDIPPKSSREAHSGSEGSRRGWPRDLVIPNHQQEPRNESYETIRTQINVNEALHPDVNKLKPSDAPTDIADDQVTTEVIPVRSTVPWDDNLTNLSIGGLLSEISLQGKFNGSDPNSVNKSGVQPMGLISDISIGGLLSEASLLGNMSIPVKLENESSWQRIFLAPSDVSLGALFSEASLLSNKNKLDAQTAEASHEQIKSPWDDTFTTVSIGGLLGLLSESSLHSIKNKLDARTMEAGHEQIQSSWDDTFTTLSIGGLLSEVSLQAKAGGNPEVKKSKSSLEPNASFYRSSDYLISAHLHAQSQMPKPSCHEPNLSILDAEETCHAFPIRKLQSSSGAITPTARENLRGCDNAIISKDSHFSGVAKMNNEIVSPKDSSCQELKTDPLRHSLGAFGEDCNPSSIEN